MKKIVLIITLLLLGFVSKAQMSDNYYWFSVGDFRFSAHALSEREKPESVIRRHAENCGGIFCEWFDNPAQATTVAKTIKEHKCELEKKYNVTFEKIGTDGSRVWFVAYNADAYIKMKQEDALREKRRAEAFQKKLDSISKNL